MFIVSRCKGSILLEFSEEVFDQMPPFVHLWNLRKNRGMISRRNTIDPPNTHCFRHLRDDHANPQPQVALQDTVPVLGDPHPMITVVKNRVAAFAVLGHGGQRFKPACALMI